MLTLVLGNVADLASVDLLAVAAGVALAGAAPRVTLAVAHVARSFVAWFLGPDPTAELQGRVQELAGQRTLILEAVGAERRRIERDLHDGVQQQLVALGIDIGRARSRIDDDPAAARRLLDDALTKVRGAVGELRVIGRGLHPAVLDDRGLDAALSSVVGAASIPISVDVALDTELPDDVAATAYYVVNESVTNILKHAHARSGSVKVAEIRDAAGSQAIRITVHDDGRGGADPSRGTGLAGIRARVEGADGTLRVDSPPGGPTTLVAVLPTRQTPPAFPPPPSGASVSEMPPLRAVVADDSVLLRDGVVRLLQDAGIEVVAAVGDADALVAAVASTHPDIALIDVRMPPTHTDEGIRAAIEIRRNHPTIAVLVLSQYVEERYASDLLTGDTAGVGYLLKDRVVDVDDFVLAVRRVAAGGSAVDVDVVRQLIGRTARTTELDRLTPRELEVLELMAEGLSNSGIAERLVISLGAVEKHISNVFTKLGLEHETSAHRRVLAVLTYLGQRD